MHVELRHRFVDLIFDVMLRMISGKRYCGTDVVSQEATEFKSVMDDVFDLLNLSLNDLFPVLQWVDLFGVEKKMKKVMKKEDNFLQNLLDEHRRNRSFSNGNDDKKTMTLVQVMLSLEETDPAFYSDENIKAIAGVRN